MSHLDNVLNEARKLHPLGWSLHWLHPNSKRPIEMNWTKVNKKALADLEKNYKPGMNLGVRLGTSSVLGENLFLAVIDCDVKGKSKADFQEMESKLKELFPENNLDTAPKVLSGRGNGSKHIYVCTQMPAKPSILARAARKVKVLMPSSVKPSKMDREALSDSEITQGYRMRPAWEIGIMGEGQQTVLPGSTHPDTGKNYIWEKAFSKKDLEKIPLVKNIVTKKLGEEKTKNDFTAVDVDIVSSSLSDDVVDLILNGKNCAGDKSASVFKASLAMCRAGFSDQEILSVLTDEDNYLGEVGFRHAQTKSRSRAANWINNYSLKKAREETNAAKDFVDEVLETPNAESAAHGAASTDLTHQHEELLADRDWREDIERSSPRDGSRPKNTVKNVVLILSNEFGSDIFMRDDFSSFELFGRDVDFKTSQVKRGTEINNNHLAEIKYWLSSHYRFEPTDANINDAIKVICASHSFHPVRDYINGLVWDGVERLDNWLFNYLGAEGPADYVRAIGRKTLCAMVARVMRPGIKFDHILILEGDQGMGKSSVVEILASPKWFTDATLNIADKDSVMTMQSVWVVEIGELSKIKKADVDHLKEFISRTTDRIRVPYGKKVDNFPRQCIFIGSTNGDEYLRDITGNRRFWPVRIYKINFEALVRDRDQLLAEAATMWNLGEKLWLDEDTVRVSAEEEQEMRREADPYEEILQKFFMSDEGKKPEWSSFSLLNIFSDFGPLPKAQQTIYEHMRVANSLKKLGFSKKRKRLGGEKVMLWERH